MAAISFIQKASSQHFDASHASRLAVGLPEAGLSGVQASDFMQPDLCRGNGLEGNVNLVLGWMQ